jgi:hypothetical protein
MSAPLSNELFFEAHRGLTQKPNSNGLGISWTTNKTYAENKATNPDWHEGYGKFSPTVVHAKVPLSSVETDSKTLRHEVVVDENLKPYHTHEVPVKSGSSIFVTGKTTIKDYKPRRRSYNPPREMKA